MTTPKAIVIASIVLAVALVIAGYFAAPGPYRFVANPNATAGVLVNTITGEVRYCIRPEDVRPGTVLRCRE